MTKMTHDLKALRELEKRLRLEEANGPSTDMDKEIFLTIDEGFSARVTGHAYTASLDAAVALVERVLPDWVWLVERVREDEEGWYGCATVVPPREGRALDVSAATPALALCLACVRALIAQGEP